MLATACETDAQTATSSGSALIRPANDRRAASEKHSQLAERDAVIQELRSQLDSLQQLVEEMATLQKGQMK